MRRRNPLDEPGDDDQLVTRGFLRTYLREELRHFKRDMLRWMLVMHAPTYAALICLFIKLGV